MHPEVALLPDERICAVGERISLIQKTRGLQWGTDSYLLAAYLKKTNARACELGCGSGVISLLCAAHGKFPEIRAIEIQPEYADLCRRNAALNALEGRITVHEGDVRAASVADTDGEVDVVFSNPPYMLPGSGKDNRTREMNIARREENGSIVDFCAAAARLLRYGGTCTVVYRPDRFVDLIDAMRKNALEPKYAVFVYPSVHDAPCLVLTEARKGGSVQLSIAPPLVIYADKSAGRYTPEMERVYAECSLRFLFP